MTYTIFEYMYRDASNCKAFGLLLLHGDFTEQHEAAIKQRCEDAEYFVAEQLGIPPLYEQLWDQYGGPNGDDHAWHEFIGLRAPSHDELIALKAWGTLEDMLVRFRSKQNWKLELSPNA